MPQPDRAVPRVLVLVATHNGAEFLREQLDSILSQDDVETHIVVSDDGSTDGSFDVARDYASHPEYAARIRLLRPGLFGSAHQNFFRLIRETEAADFDAIALSDQDDIWVAGKLARHYKLLSLPDGIDGHGQYSAISSNVTAFDESGRQQLVVKNQLQRSHDYAFESGGPGSTFLLTPDTYAFVRAQLIAPGSHASRAKSHDWLIYALVRASGRRWFIDGESTVSYRQHADNVLGANEGWRQNAARFAAIANGDHRQQVGTIVRACLEVAPPQTSRQLGWLLQRIEQKGPVSRLQLARQVHRFRRRQRDRLALAGTILLGIW